MTKLDTATYEVKAVKFFIGIEGQGYNANLYRNGKKVAFVIDAGDGGCVTIQWASEEAKDNQQQYLDEMNAMADGFAGETAHEYFITCLVEKWDMNIRAKKSVVFRKRPNYSSLDFSNSTYELTHGLRSPAEAIKWVFENYPQAIVWTPNLNDWVNSEGNIATYAKCEHTGEQVHEYDPTSILGDAYYCGTCRELLQVG